MKKISISKIRYIMILGPDGCGKTSIANWLVDKSSFKELKIKEFSFNILPSFSKIIYGKKRVNKKEGKFLSGMSYPLNSLKGFVLAVWYGIDFVLGWLYIKINRKKTIIFTRSYYDFLYQRAYRNVPSIIYKFFFMIGPKPDLIILPIREKENIYADKPELSTDEIEIQYKILINYFKNKKNFLLLDSTGGFDKTKENLNKLFDFSQ